MPEVQTTEDDTSNDSNGADEVEKEVTVIAYSRPDEAFNSGRHSGSSDKRDFASEVVPSVDWYAKTESTNTAYYVVLGDENDPTSQHRLDIDRHEYEELNEKIANEAIDTGNVVRTLKDEEINETHEYSTYSVGKKFLLEVLSDELPQTLITDEMGTGETGLEKHEGYSHVSYETHEGDSLVKLNAATDTTRVLVHQDRRTEENRYEGDEYVQAVQITLSFGPASEAAVDELSERLTEKVHKALNEQEWVRKVRIASCTVSREGDCFV